MRIQKFIDAAGPVTQEVEVEAYGVKDTLTIKRLTGLEMDHIRAGLVGPDGKIVDEKQETYRSRLIAASLIDDGETYDPIEVGTWPDGVLNGLMRAINKVNGMNAEAIKDAVKNSVKTSGDGGSST